MAIIVYGIKNCNTVKKAVTWLQAKKVPFTFHDYKTRGITKEKLTGWVDQVGWERLVNNRGTTWRQLPAEVRDGIRSASAAIDLMQEKTSVIKRPVVEQDGLIKAIGFEEADYRKLT